MCQYEKCTDEELLTRLRSGEEGDIRLSDGKIQRICPPESKSHVPDRR